MKSFEYVRPASVSDAIAAASLPGAVYLAAGTNLLDLMKGGVSRPDAAVLVRTPEQVAAVVRLANKLRVPITPWGGGSGVQGAANADRGGIIVDLRQLSRVRAIDEKSLTCVVEAGKTPNS